MMGKLFPLSEGTAVPHPASLPAFPRHLLFQLSAETPGAASHLKMLSDLLTSKKLLNTQQLRSSKDWALFSLSPREVKSHCPLFYRRHRCASALFCSLAPAHEGVCTKQEGLKLIFSYELCNVVLQ